MKIYPNITSIIDYRSKIEEADSLKIKEVAFFPTCLDFEERKKAYSLLKESCIERIPFVHLRSDMSEDELKFLISEFKTCVFNIHMDVERPLKYDLSRFKEIIFVENVYNAFKKDELEKWGGICLDLSHLENSKKRNPEMYEHNLKMCSKYKVGCNHISGVQDFYHIDETGEKRFDNHFLKDFCELDYLKSYPLNLFSDFCAIELENSIKEQMECIKYIEKLLL